MLIPVIFAGFSPQLLDKEQNVLALIIETVHSVFSI